MPELTWSFQPVVDLPLAAVAVSYGAGTRRLWHRAGADRGVRYRDASTFAAGWLVLAIALVTPLHELGEILFSAHMVQHELLMVIAATLLLLGRPAIAMA